MSETSEKIKIVAVLMAEGRTTEEIATELKAPKLFIENTIKFIKEIAEISKPKPAASDKLDFIDLISPLREFVSGTFAGACIASEYGNNKHHETKIDFTYNGEEYIVSLYKE